MFQKETLILKSVELQLVRVEACNNTKQEVDSWYSFRIFVKSLSIFMNYILFLKEQKFKQSR